MVTRLTLTFHNVDFNILLNGIYSPHCSCVLVKPWNCFRLVGCKHARHGKSSYISGSPCSYPCKSLYSFRKRMVDHVAKINSVVGRLLES